MLFADGLRIEMASIDYMCDAGYADPPNHSF